MVELLLLLHAERCFVLKVSSSRRPSSSCLAITLLYLRPSPEDPVIGLSHILLLNQQYRRYACGILTSDKNYRHLLDFIMMLNCPDENSFWLLMR